MSDTCLLTYLLVIRTMPFCFKVWSSQHKPCLIQIKPWTRRGAMVANSVPYACYDVFSKVEHRDEQR